MKSTSRIITILAVITLSTGALLSCEDRGSIQAPGNSPIPAPTVVALEHR